MFVWIVQGLAFALALMGFFIAAAVENRFQSFLRAPKNIPSVKPVAVPVAAE
jgi:hypothetical protein